MNPQDKRKHPYSRYIIQIAAVIAIAIVVAVVIYFLVLPSDLFSEFVSYIYVGILLIAGYFVIRIISRLIKKYGESELQITQVNAIKNLFQIVAVLILSFSILLVLGIDVTSALVGAGFLGIVLGLAAQTVLGNVFAGVAILAAKQLKVGDRVTINIGQYGYIPQTYAHDDMIPGYTGIVTEIGLTHTKVLGDNNVPVSYPNSVLIQSMIINHSRVAKRTVQIRMDINRDIPIEQFEQALRNLLTGNTVIDPSYPIEVQPLVISDHKYNVAIKAWVNGEHENPGKAVLNQKAVEAMHQIRKKAGKEVYENFPIRIGDQIVVRGEFGTVEEVTDRFTIIKIWDNRRQVIPNHVLDNEVFTNYTLTDPMRIFPITVMVPYDTDLDKAKQIMIEEAKAHPKVLTEKDPTFQVLDFSKGAITLRLLFLAENQGTAFGTACDIRLAIKHRFDQANIKLSCPTTYISPDSKLTVESLERQNKNSERKAEEEK